MPVCMLSRAVNMKITGFRLKPPLRPNNLAVWIFWGSRRTRREPVHTTKKHEHSMHKVPGQDLIPGQSWCKARLLI